MKAYRWILENAPEAAEGTDPAFFEVNLPGDKTGASLGNIILVDPNYESMAELVDTIAHELMHAQNGFFGNIWS